MSRARVLVHHRVPDGRPDAVEDAYRAAARDLAGVPGLLGTELLDVPGDPAARVLLMDWTSVERYRSWEERHRAAGHPSPLRPFQDRARPGGHHHLFVLAARYPAAPPVEAGSSDPVSPEPEPDENKEIRIP